MEVITVRRGPTLFNFEDQMAKDDITAQNCESGVKFMYQDS